MQIFIRPKCGHESTYDPWIGSAHCPECDHKPDTRRSAVHRRRPKKRTAAYQPLLDELLAHWNGTHTPDPDFTIQTADLAPAFFKDCQRMLGEEPDALGGYMEFVRNYQPKQSEILMFVGAYLLLKQGNRAEAARHLRALTMMVRKFPDPWIWLTATTDAPAERKEYLENAVMLNPAHPLANDAMAILQGRVSLTEGPRGGQPGQQVTTTKCPRCGGELHYEPGAMDVVCPYRGHRVPLRQINVLDGEATFVGDVRLKRYYQGQTWAEVEHIVHCQSCGVEMGD